MSLPAAAHRPAAAPATRARATVLAIEDKADIRRLIRMTLEFRDFAVLEAASGEEGLALARRERPDLVLLDVMMPGIGGLAAARTMAEDPELCRIPVVMLSALGTAADVDSGLLTGARAYLVKPFSPKQLLELVRELIDAAPRPAADPVRDAAPCG
jgi:DNA-binding response OmpR family regulator